MNTAFIEKEIAIAIINDDYSGMMNTEMESIEDFMIDNNYSYLISADEYEYTRCEITNKYAECLKCILK